MDDQSVLYVLEPSNPVDRNWCLSCISSSPFHVASQSFDFTHNKPMKSRYQRRLWRYVTSGRRYKLRRLLKHHREALDLDQFVGPKKRTPLHQSCAQRDRKIAVLLLKYGADPSVLDQRGDTVLHVAARQAVRKGGTGEVHPSNNSSANIWAC